ncbi:hypothetical protein LZG04_21495 [Saccharothrix sp. S26]|uniref:hypothetical protein n=1 Tax=Saccharothrix sp. S26 TaxID=2907215 RepID=UPI001F35CDAA|nr:hypothetical protein [Saccharothrix sp. S26]MCE6997356.1 hypothetical protein [Saccharothrix sp. S26]
MTIIWLWLRAHRWPTLALTSGLVAVIGLVVGGRYVPIPSLGEVRRLDVPLSQLLPLVLACAIGLHTKAPTSLFHVIPRSPVAQRAELITAILATAVAACLLIPNSPVALRNLAGLAGLALVTASVAGATRSWTLPLFYLMCCLLFGTRPRHTAEGGAGAQWWAFAIADADERRATAVALVLCAAGVLLFVLRGPRNEVTAQE